MLGDLVVHPSGLAAQVGIVGPGRDAGGDEVVAIELIRAHRGQHDFCARAHRLKIGVIIGIAGVAIMIGLQALEGLGGGNVALLAQLAIVAATLSYAFSGVYGRRFSGMGIAPVVVATGQLTAAAVMLIPIALFVDQPWTLPSPSLNVWWSIVGLAVVSTSLAYIIYFRILAVAGATNLLLVTLLIPVSAVLLGFTVLGERLEPRHFGGMALLAIGLIIIDGRLLNLMGINSSAVIDS